MHPDRIKPQVRRSPRTAWIAAAAVVAGLAGCLDWDPLNSMMGTLILYWSQK